MKIIWEKANYDNGKTTSQKHPHLLFEKSKWAVNLSVIIFMLTLLSIIPVSMSKEYLDTPQWVITYYARFLIAFWAIVIVFGMINKNTE